MCLNSSIFITAASNSSQALSNEDNFTSIFSNEHYLGFKISLGKEFIAFLIIKGLLSF